MTLSSRVFFTVDALPDQWDDVAQNNLFLTKRYFKVLEQSAPANMTCFYIGVFREGRLVGCALSQFLDMGSLSSFGARDHCIKESIRLFFFKRFVSRVLILGNNMLSGENAFVFADNLPPLEYFRALNDGLDEIGRHLAQEKRDPHLTVWKDFCPDHAREFQSVLGYEYFRFSAQPNMILSVRPAWKTERDYVNDLTKKYRDQYKRARKKAEGITMRQLSAQEIEKNKSKLYELYLTVAQNAPFNTFYLRDNHWLSLKENLGDDFLFYGYFKGDQLIGFDTLIKNGSTMETYFLGYDGQVQKQRMLYLNMLYNMLGYAIKNGFKRVIFARTAMEIKSSVGAKPVELVGFMKHRNSIFQALLPKLYHYFEPEAQWQQRHPFKHP